MDLVAWHLKESQRSRYHVSVCSKTFALIPSKMRLQIIYDGRRIPHG